MIDLVEQNLTFIALIKDFFIVNFRQIICSLINFEITQIR